MTDKEKLEAIKAEIERMNKEAYGVEYGWAVKCETLCRIQSYMDSLPEELVSEDLEKAARKYAGIPEYSPHDLKYCVQDKKAKYDAVLYGANLQKQQMMKDAIDGEYWDNNIILEGGIRGMYDDGDKVKLIIIKHE